MPTRQQGSTDRLIVEFVFERTLTRMRFVILDSVREVSASPTSSIVKNGSLFTQGLKRGDSERRWSTACPGFETLCTHPFLTTPLSFLKFFSMTFVNLTVERAGCALLASSLQHPSQSLPQSFHGLSCRAVKLSSKDGSMMKEGKAVTALPNTPHTTHATR